MEERQPQRRRKSAEVAFEQKQWQERLDAHFARALEAMGSPEYFKLADVLWHIDESAETSIERSSLRRNATAALQRLGCEKMLNPNASDGRWNFEFGAAFVFCKKGCPILDRWGVKQEVGL